MKTTDRIDLLLLIRKEFGKNIPFIFLTDINRVMFGIIAEGESNLVIVEKSAFPVIAYDLLSKL